MGHIASFELLCTGSIATSRDVRGENLLHIAVSKGVTGAVKFLCEKVDIDSKNDVCERFFESLFL